MAEKQYFVTEEGLASLEKELEYLKTVKRKSVAEKIKTALSFGDLSVSGVSLVRADDFEITGRFFSARHGDIHFDL